jgi:hypothetical protein
MEFNIKIGDRVRILSLPNQDKFIHKDTIKAYNNLIKRGRSLRIYTVDKYGNAWFNFKLKTRNGKWEYHSMAIYKQDDNWVKVNSRI